MAEDGIKPTLEIRIWGGCLVFGWVVLFGMICHIYWKFGNMKKKEKEESRRNSLNFHIQRVNIPRTTTDYNNGNQLRRPVEDTTNYNREIPRNDYDNHQSNLNLSRSTDPTYFNNDFQGPSSHPPFMRQERPTMPDHVHQPKNFLAQKSIPPKSPNDLNNDNFYY